MSYRLNSSTQKALYSLQTRVPRVVLQRLEDMSPSMKEIVDRAVQKATQDKAKQKSVCQLCMEELEVRNITPEKQIMSTVCGHLFCKACIEHVLKLMEMCPMCRKTLNVQSIHPVYFNI